MATKKTSKNTPKSTKNARNLGSFEHNLEKLESIVAKMEDGDCSLDEAFSMFEEGVGISKSCSKMLESYERKIYLIKEGKSKSSDKNPDKNSDKRDKSDSEHYLDIFTDEV